MMEYLTHKDWNPDVRKGLNDLLRTYGKDGPCYEPDLYVVSDSDNTISVFDVEHQLAVHQLQVMAFAFAPQEIETVLLSGLSDPKKGRFGCTLDGQLHSYEEWVQDIREAYEALYESYGPFTAEGLDPLKAKTVQKDQSWMEFACKMRAMYTLVTKEEDGTVSCPWLLCWFQGMSEQQVYDLAVRSHRYYAQKETQIMTWTSPAERKSRIHQAQVKWVCGIQVTENIRELFFALKKQGIGVWVCSASGTDSIRAAIDVFGLHDAVDGLMAMTMVLKDGVYQASYDFTEGHAWRALPDGVWEKDTAVTGVQTQGQGKVTAIENVLVSRYGHGPLAGFGDSAGDFPFCTQYASMKLAVCFNRADRKITDGGGVLAEIAMYEKEMGYDLAKAQQQGDILYLLQGREENGLRTLRPSEKTVRALETEEKLFAGLSNEQQLEWMIRERPSVGEALAAAAENFPQKTVGYRLRK